MEVIFVFDDGRLNDVVCNAENTVKCKDTYHATDADERNEICLV